MAETHEVLNQPPPLVGYEPFAGDVAFFETVHRYGGGWARDPHNRAFSGGSDARSRDGKGIATTTLGSAVRSPLFSRSSARGVFP